MSGNKKKRKQMLKKLQGEKMEEKKVRSYLIVHDDGLDYIDCDNVEYTNDGAVAFLTDKVLVAIFASNKWQRVMLESE